MPPKKAANNTLQEQELSEIQPTCPPKHAKSACMFISTLLAAAALGVSSYSWYMAKQYQAKTQTHLTAELTAVKQHVREVTDTLNQQQTELAKTQHHLIALAELKDANSWQMQEVRYLLRVADLNLKYQHDPATALALLLSIDQQLAKADNPQLDKFRQTLARDIAAVRAMQAVDTLGILAQLKTLTDRVETLPTIISNEQPQVETSQPTIEQPVSTHWWQNAWLQIRYALGHLVVIHRSNQTTQPMVTKEQQALLVTLIQMHLIQAQWAVLHYQQDLFIQNIQRATQLAQTTFSTSPEKASLIASLAELQKVNLAVSAPELTNTLATLNTLTPKVRPSKLATLAKPANEAQEAALV